MTESPAATQLSTRRLVVQAVLRTDVGKVRSENQDFGMLTTQQEEARSHPGGRLLIVADGMGGHRGGAHASRLAADTVKSEYLSSANADPAAALQYAVSLANARVFAESQTNPELRGMGTTTSALVIRGTEAWLAHVGDSRIYLIRGDSIKQLTEDHSLVATMVREGLLTTQEAETHPRRNVLQRSVGVGEDLEIDIRGPFEVQENDTFILCSDGLHGLVKEEEMARIAKLPLQQAANELVKLALERGAPDNVTVIVARVVRADRVGEDTLTDQADRALYDETMKETAPLRATQ
jgi:PPM family protein phosphatase